MATSPAGSLAEPADPDAHPHDEAGGDESDRESDLLSEVDEDQFEDYDPATAQIEHRPISIDEDVAKSLKASKRKPADASAPKKVKEGRREKKRRTGPADEVDEVDGESLMSSRPRRARPVDGERRIRQKSPVQEEEDESNLTPEERRRRAIERAMDNALKNPTKRRRKKDEVVCDDSLTTQSPFDLTNSVRRILKRQPTR